METKQTPQPPPQSSFNFLASLINGNPCTGSNTAQVAFNFLASLINGNDSGLLCHFGFQLLTS